MSAPLTCIQFHFFYGEQPGKTAAKQDFFLRTEIKAKITIWIYLSDRKPKWLIFILKLLFKNNYYCLWKNFFKKALSCAFSEQWIHFQATSFLFTAIFKWNIFTFLQYTEFLPLRKHNKKKITKKAPAPHCAFSADWISVSCGRGVK